MPFRIGSGYDIHPFGADRPLVLGGVPIAGEPGLVGHSDADAVLHAIIDALLGAAACGDIGQLFPPGDPRFKDADSLVLLKEAATQVRAAGWRVENVDVTVITEHPRLRPHVAAICSTIAAALALDVAQVSVKAKTNEGLDAIGRGEALAAWAVALVEGSGNRESGIGDGARMDGEGGPSMQSSSA